MTQAYSDRHLQLRVLLSMSRIAIITGITGQDGSYLAELLLEKNYSVYGIVRRHSTSHLGRLEAVANVDRINLIYGDMTDQTSLFNAFHTVLSREGNDFVRLEVYNLAAQSHVKVSFDVPEYTAETDALGVLRLLEVIQQQSYSVRERVRMYQASTSELFGDVVESPQNENTPFNPQSPYATAKLYAYHTVRNYRDSYGLYACNGILFNHTSPRRGEEFVERKISLGVRKVMDCLSRSEDASANLEPGCVLKLGNLDAVRDIGHARDYVEGMWLMLQQESPRDFVLSTGESMSVRQMVCLAFSVYGKTVEWVGEGAMERGYCDGKLVVSVDPKHYRPLEVNQLLGDAGKARRIMGWSPRTGMEDTLRDVYEHDKRLNRAAIY